MRKRGRRPGWPGAEGGRGVGDEVGRWEGGDGLESGNHREDLAFLGATGEPLEGFGQSSDKMCLRLQGITLAAGRGK